MNKEFIEMMLDAGLSLVPIKSGDKCPSGVSAIGWNKKEFAYNKLEDFQDPNKSQNLGLLHAWSGTCAIDIDDFDATLTFFDKYGVDLIALFADESCVQIKSPSSNRGKLLFRLPVPMTQKQLNRNHDLLDGKQAVDKKSIVDFRCATRSGLTCQDVIFGYHPAGGVYELIGDVYNIPMIPDKLLALWQMCLDYKPVGHNSTGVYSGDKVGNVELRQMLECIPPDVGREDWMKVSYALRSMGEPFETFDDWSSGGDNYDEAEAHRLWFDSDDRDIGWNAGTLINLAKEYGYKHSSVAKEKLKRATDLLARARKIK